MTQGRLTNAHGSSSGEPFGIFFLLSLQERSNISDMHARPERKRGKKESAAKRVRRTSPQAVGLKISTFFFCHVSLSVHPSHLSPPRHSAMHSPGAPKQPPPPHASFQSTLSISSFNGIFFSFQD